MKTICILTYERTGSGWLCDAFNGKNCISVHELFSNDPTLLFANLYKFFEKIYNVDKRILDTIYKIYNPDNFFIDASSHILIKKKIVSQNLYNMSLLSSIQNACIKHNYNFIFKIFPQHIHEDITLDKIINVSDLIILNYRKNVLNTYISLQLAKATGKWYSMQNRTNDIKVKLVWDTDQYLNYYKNINNTINLFKSSISPHNYISLSYEELHENTNLKNETDKIVYLNNKLQDTNISLNQNIIFSKQNNFDYVSKAEELFVNYEHFRSSLHNIPINIEI